VDPDDNVCLCFRVSLRKIRAYLARENPPRASLLSECLGAGTGCRWCVPFLEELHRQHTTGRGLGPNSEPDLRISPEQYAAERLNYHRTGRRAIAPSAAERPDSDAAAS